MRGDNRKAGRREGENLFVRRACGAQRGGVPKNVVPDAGGDGVFALRGEFGGELTSETEDGKARFILFAEPMARGARRSAAV
jgi:hypothetical protein